MNPAHARCLLNLVGVGVLMVLFACLVPGFTSIRGDDFAYIESAAETIRLGRWVSSDWLGPYNVPLPLLSAAVYGVTGNFWISTWGLCCVFAIVMFVQLRIWLKPQTIWDDLLIWAFFLNPVLLNKILEYTGFPLGICLTLAALVAWKRGKKVQFFLFVLLGVTNRQSAICLLAIPLISLILQWRHERRTDQAQLVLTGLSGIASVLFVCAMPDTFARVLVSARWQARFSLESFLGNIVLGVVFCAFFATVWSVIRGENLARNCRENFGRPWMSLALMGAGAWMVLGKVTFLRCETPGIDRFADIITLVAVFVGAWGLNWRKLPPAEIVGCCVIFVVLVAMRGAWWDYYLIELALMLAWPRFDAANPPGVGRILVGTGLIAALCWTIFLSIGIRSAARRVMAYEPAIRAGRVKITEASQAPFGYLAWKLFPISRENARSTMDFADFLKYVEADRTRVSGVNLEVNRTGDRVSLHPSHEKRFLPYDYRPRDYPLTNVEWRNYIEASAQP